MTLWKMLGCLSGDLLMDDIRIRKVCTPPKTNMEPEKKSLEKEIPIKNP